jgi:hypothetical protein
MTKLPGVSGRECARALARIGFRFRRQEGGHMILRKVAQDTLESTNEQGIANSSARLLPEGTVVLSRTASVGFVTIMGRPMATSQDFVNWVCGPEL